jgi:hypothetical protein
MKKSHVTNNYSKEINIGDFYLIKRLCPLKNLEPNFAF